MGDAGLFISVGIHVGNQGSLPQSRDDYIIIIVWRMRGILHTKYNQYYTHCTAHISTIHALINVHEYHCIVIRMRCWLLDDYY